MSVMVVASTTSEQKHADVDLTTRKYFCFACSMRIFIAYACLAEPPSQDEALAVADCGVSPHCRRGRHSVCPGRHGTKERTRFAARFLSQGNRSRNRHDGRMHWQDERGCKGSGCKYEMGLSWYHYTCEDCECVPEPKKPRQKKR